MFNDLAEKYAAVIEYIAAKFSSVDNNDLLMCIDNAWRAIVKYLWVDYDSFTSEYFTPVVMLSRAYLTNLVKQNQAFNGNREVTQMSEGSRSVTFKSGYVTLDKDGLTEEVKAALPPRKLRVIPQ